MWKCLSLACQKSQCANLLLKWATTLELQSLGADQLDQLSRQPQHDWWWFWCSSNHKITCFLIFTWHFFKYILGAKAFIWCTAEDVAGNQRERGKDMQWGLWTRGERSTNWAKLRPLTFLTSLIQEASHSGHFERESTISLAERDSARVANQSSITPQMSNLQLFNCSWLTTRHLCPPLEHL